jgi:hypothetical protein
MQLDFLTRDYEAESPTTFKFLLKTQKGNCTAKFTKQGEKTNMYKPLMEGV